MPFTPFRKSLQELRSAIALVVVWSQSTNDSSLWYLGKLYATQYTSQTGWSVPVLVGDVGAHAPRVGVDNSNNVIVLWNAVHSYFSIKPAGGNWSVPQKLAGAIDLMFVGYNDGRQNSLAVADNGIALAAWKKDYNGSIYAQAYR